MMYGSDNRLNLNLDSQTERENMIQKSVQTLFTEGFHHSPRNPITPKNNFRKMQSSFSFSPFLIQALSSPRTTKRSAFDSERETNTKKLWGKDVDSFYIVTEPAEESGENKHQNVRKKGHRKSQKERKEKNRKSLDGYQSKRMETL